MNAYSRLGGQGKIRGSRTLRIAPTTRAIRAALAVSATVLAMAGSDIAVAGTCAYSVATNTETCDGAFANLPGGNFAPVQDLTLVVDPGSTVDPAAGVAGINAYWGGAVTVISSADITTVSATGIQAFSSIAADVANYGAILTSGYNSSAGISAISSVGTATVDNSGEIDASVAGWGNYARGIFSYAHDDDAVTNSGDISATATLGIVLGIEARSGHGIVTVDNSGAISASSYFPTTGVLTHSIYGSLIENSGSIDVVNTSSGGREARGVYAVTGSGDNIIDNSGSISATSSGGAVSGVRALSTTGAIDILNIGSVVALDSSHQAYAFGEFARAYGDVTVINSGTVSSEGGRATGVRAFSLNEYAYPYSLAGDLAFTNGDTGEIDVVGRYSATGIAVTGNNTVVVNDGLMTIAAQTNSGSQVAVATAILAYAQDDLSVDNGGLITVTTSDVAAFAGGSSTGIHASSHDVVVYNSGGLVIDAQGGDSAQATGVYGSGYSVQFHSADSSDITVVSVGLAQAYSQAFAIGIDLHGTQSAIDLRGTLTATSTSSGSDGFAAANGVLAFGSDFSQVTTAAGSSIDVYANARNAIANGVIAQGNNDLTITNGAMIDALAIGSIGRATGISGFGYGDIAASNSGDIHAEFVGAHGTAYGAKLVSTVGDVAFVNSGNIFAGSGYLALGVNAVSFGSVSVTNADTASITAIGDERAAGIVALGQSAAAVTNSGSITVEGSWAYGICASACYGDASGVSSVVNASTGNITVTADGQAIGVIAHGDSDVLVDNFGNISVTSTIGYATGIEAPSGFGSAAVTNAATGNIVVTGGYGATGIAAFGDSTSSIDNHGDVSVAAVYSLHRSNGYVTANGLFGYVGEVSNSGSITVLAANNPDDPYDFFGETVVANGVRVNLASNTSVNNSGSITVTADNSPSNYVSGDAFATGVRIFSNGSALINSGSITVAANGIDVAGATGVLSHGFVGSSDSVTTATASAVSRAYATGVETLGNGDIDASGAITASASAYEFAVARGVIDYNSDSAYISTHAGSSIAVDASAYTAFALGLAVIDANHLALVNAGDIHVVASGEAGYSAGLWANSMDNLPVSNSGNITAEFEGGNGAAYGAVITSNGQVIFANSGNITASSAGVARAVELNSDSATTLLNTGTITATSATYGGIALLTGNSVDTVGNSGTITGALITGGGADTFTNSAAGLWRAIGVSNFGAGDDIIDNAGTIHMYNAAILLGSSYTGDQFSNAGLITVSGDNLIDMGTGPDTGSDTVTVASVPPLNPYAFVNDGIISFVDGAANDTLTITGDFAGDGAINMDVSALNNASDVLYIDGSVVEGSVNTINVNLVGAPTSASSEISLVRVSGDSTAGDFILGGINFTTNPFLTQDVSLISHIDASNATDDVFSLDIEVTGLSAPGALAASIAPGAQSLMNSQVGTWRQRMGVIDKTIQGKPSLWARTFQDSGTIEPDALGGNFGAGGNLAFDQRNSGTEVGADFALSDKLSVGVLLAKVDANQKLSGAGVDKFNGDTRGLYATWISPGGFYLDASYRWMDFDARLTSAAGEMQTHGEADALNLELGYAWTLANGLKIEPQFQHTRVKVGDVDALSVGSANFRSDGGDSSRDRLGVMFRESFGSNGTVWTPYASVNAVHTSDGRSAYSIDDTFFGASSTGGTSALIEGGLSVQIGHLSIFGSANWQDGGALQSFSGGQLGLRYNW